jgi:hypothetical protein
MILGAGISFFAYSIKMKYLGFSKHVERVEGKLVGYELVKINNKNRKVPVASYVTQSGIAFTQNSTESFFASNAKIGTPVVVFYNTDNPREMMIQGKKFGMMSGVLIIGGIVFCLTGFIFLLNYEDYIHLFQK